LERFMPLEEREQRKNLVFRVGEAALKASSPPPTATVLGRAEIVPDVHVALRGDFASRGQKVEPGFPDVLSGNGPVPDSGARRKALALWLTDPGHPLTARVMVNRIWQAHFGRGIVATSNDFGRQGELPTHPELLDWLAVEFVESGWSVKAMH